MSRSTADYVTMLEQLKIPKEDVKSAAELLTLVPEIEAFFCDPSIAVEKKHAAAEKLFPTSVRDLIRLLCDNQDMDRFREIAEQFQARPREGEDSPLQVTLTCVTEPEEAVRERLLACVQKQYPGRTLVLSVRKDASLIGGFRLQVDGKEYDWSYEGKLQALKQKMAQQAGQSDSLSGVISVLRETVRDSDFDETIHEVGTVRTAGDGIVSIDGLDHAMYGEVVQFDNGEKGMVQDIRRDTIRCILFGRDRGIGEGSRVIRTKKRAGIPVGEAFLGRVVNALGEPMDGQGAIEAADFYPMEREAPSIADRSPVTRPMETGILSIDSMFPIGRGQRELIIGDRQTGKTSIALDTMLNQKGKGVICIYVAIGQKASTVASVVQTLKTYGALPYSIVVAATASDPASLQYAAPYAGTSMAEYFMHQGKDVLIVYDDLSKHAVAYRAISLLIGRSPGREAYPGDVFYLHSRLLERSSCLKKELGGGSITALPIIETQSGDVSAYIPTNVISITDGQIFLESSLFFSGMRPAVNVGLSVSRVGGAAQTKAMKQTSGSLRIDLAQYREMEVFTQFDSDLDENTRAQLAYGSTLMELLKQPRNHPLSIPEQVVSLTAAVARVLVDVPVKDVKRFQTELLDWMRRCHEELLHTIEETGRLEEETKTALLEAIREFKGGWS